jgi:hypothetical protein
MQENKEKSKTVKGWIEKTCGINKRLQEATEILEKIVTIPAPQDSPNPENPTLAETLSTQLSYLEEQSVYLLSLSKEINDKF